METTEIWENTTELFSTTENLGRDIEIIPEEPVTSLTSNIVITVIIAVFLLFGSVGNILTLIVIAKTKSLHIPPNFFIVSLCISDLISALFCSPIWLYKRTWGFFRWEWSWETCQLYWIMDFTTNYATALHILSFAIVRFVAVKRPFAVHSITTKKVLPFIIGIWIFSLGLSAPLLWLVGVDNLRFLRNIGKDWPACSILVKDNRTCCYDQYNTYMTVAGPAFFYIPELLVIFFSVTIARALLRRRRWMQGFSNIYSINDQRRGSNHSVISNQSSVKSNQSTKASEVDACSNVRPQSTSIQEEEEIVMEEIKDSSENNAFRTNSLSDKRCNSRSVMNDEDNDHYQIQNLSSNDNGGKNENDLDIQTQSIDSQPSKYEVSQNDPATSEDAENVNQNQNNEALAESKQGKLSKSSINFTGSDSSTTVQKDEICGHDNPAFEDDKASITSDKASSSNEDKVLSQEQSEANSVNSDNKCNQVLARRTSSLYQDSESVSTTLQNYNEESLEHSKVSPTKSFDTSRSSQAFIASSQNEITSSSAESLNDSASQASAQNSRPKIEADPEDSNGRSESHDSAQITTMIKEKLCISKSILSFSNYGTTDKDQSLNSDEVEKDSQCNMASTEDNAGMDVAVSDSNGSLPAGFEVRNVKIRSASFYGMKQDKNENTVNPTGNIVPKQSLHGRFKSRNNASFYDTIREESETGQDRKIDTFKAVSSRPTHHRRVSEHYPNPVLYNRKTSAISFNPVAEERRTNSFYRDRRTTATSEKSVFSCNSRRSSNASLALERQYQQERATFTQLSLVNISFMIGYIPITVYLMWTSNITSDSRNSVIDYWFGVVAYLCLRFSECMNPVIYNFSSGNIRDATRAYLKKIFKRTQSINRSSSLTHDSTRR